MPFPDELRSVPQWLVSGEDKVPRSPRTGKNADVRDRSLYVSYDEAVAYAKEHGLDVGFALTSEDPFAVIDLDEPENPEQAERHLKILEAFDTYAETSRSGNGIHIWCRAQVPRGVRRDRVELYGDARYIICTGRVYKDRPVSECQSLVNQLFEEMARGQALLTTLEEHEALLSDAEVVEMGNNAVNGEKFLELCQGHWQDEYPSQSEADYALMNMLCYYSRSNEQCKRLFRMSALGKRSKADRDAYLDRMIAKIRAEEAPEVDLGLLQAAAQIALVKAPSLPPAEIGTGGPVPDTGTGFLYPPGFIGEIARYITDSSTRPVRQVGTAAALALCAGILGRQYNISGTGLNLYLILLAKTGVGKEGGAAGIERLLSAARPTAPVIDSFVGPGTFASGQAIIRTLDAHPAFFSVLGEFGLTLQMLSDPNAGGHLIVMRRVLLDLYTKSGQSSVLYSTAYSDKEKNTKTLFAPAMTIFGESTPEAFYAGLSSTHVADGLIPRFLIIEYPGDRPNRNPRAFEEPDPALVERLVQLVEIALRMQANNTWADVQLDASAKEILDLFDHECDKHIRGGSDEAHRQLWNRAHLKALRMTALLAAADRPHDPVATGIEAQWSVNMVQQDIAALENRFDAGDIGDGASKQMVDLQRVIRRCLELKKEGAEWARLGVVSYRYLMQRTANLSSFRNDRTGATTALRRVLGDLEQSGMIAEIPRRQAQETLGTSAKMYGVVDWSCFTV